MKFPVRAIKSIHKHLEHYGEEQSALAWEALTDRERRQLERGYIDEQGQFVRWYFDGLRLRYKR